MEDLEKAHDLKPNDALTLRNHADVKKMLKNYAKGLKDLNKAHNIIVSKICK